MIYRAIGVMSGSSLDGLDIAWVEFNEQAGKWRYKILEAECYPYSPEWVRRLENAISLPGYNYHLLHAEYGDYIGREINRFIDKYQLQYKVTLVASHGHTTFHAPSKKMTAQLGNGAAIAAKTGLPVVNDLRALDVALGGQGAPLVPVGEKLLFSEYDYFLNIGGIANISLNSSPYIAFDICPANRVLNKLANDVGKLYDEGGKMAESGEINESLLEKLNDLDYYKQPYPKSLSNDFGTDMVYPLIKDAKCGIADSLRTYTGHIVLQVKNAIVNSPVTFNGEPGHHLRLLATGGGALNTFLIGQLRIQLKDLHIEVVVPDRQLVNFKEALITAFIGVLRWRQENNVFATVTGAARNSIGGSLWMGQEA